MASPQMLTVVAICVILIQTPLFVLFGLGVLLTARGKRLRNSWEGLYDFKGKARKIAFYRDVKIDISQDQIGPPIVGFFHPYANAGGGGERVLWTAIETIQSAWPRHICVVYTGDKESKEDILARVKTRFNIQLSGERLVFARLTKRHLVEDKAYPRFTLLRQSIASVQLVLEALELVPPDVFIDTMGYSFTYWPVQQMLRCPILAYVHYPTISSDMLNRVASREYRPGTEDIPKGRLWTLSKLIYYKFFALLYGYAGKVPDFVLCNSTWTGNHIKSLWARPYSVVYPPCDVSALCQFAPGQRRREIVSISQFRPEKDHQSQLTALQILLSRRPEWRWNGQKPVKLLMMGSVRDQGDEQRVNHLKKQALDMGISNEVEFVVNAPFAVLSSALASASVGISTMWNEHFGIGLVEMMAAGLLVVAHNSGGPALDILCEHRGRQVGFLAQSAASFADCLENIFEKDSSALDQVRQSAREAALDKFSTEEFKSAWKIAMSALVQLDKYARKVYRQMPYPLEDEPLPIG